MLRIDDLTLSVGGLDVVRGLNVEVPAGGRLAVVGRSGAGKTSLLEAIAGRMPIAHGSISHEARGQERIVFVPQQPVLFAALTVAENIEVFRQSAGFADGDLAAIDQLLESYGLTQLATKLGGEISGGEQQRTALARAVAVAPSLLLVDEPTARQDADHRDLVTSSLVDAAREGVLVVATHEPEVAAVCDRVVTIDPD